MTALADQAGAASGEAARIMAVLGARALAGQLTLCPHLSWTAPQPSFWCAYAPGRLRCTMCAQDAQRRIRGTREDRRCDHCHTIGPTIHPGMTQLPPAVVDLRPHPRCIPPVMLMFGLCPGCQQTDGAGAP